LEGKEVTNREKIFDIRGRLLTGIISYEQAKIEAMPVIKEMNIEAKDIADKHGRKFSGFTFTSLMR